MSILSKKTVVASKENLAAAANLLGTYLPTEMPLLKAAFPIKYSNPDLIVNLITDANKLLSLPSVHTRIAARKNARLAMVAYLRDIMQATNLLRQYITMAYSSNMISSKLIDAGIIGNVETARRSNWLATQQMISGMRAFAFANELELIQQGSMPVTFPANLAKLETNFQREYFIFGDANCASQLSTEDVNSQCKAVYDRILDICADARAVTYNNPARRDLYFFSALSRMAVNSRSIGGVRFGLFDSVTSRPVVGAIVRTPYYSKSGTSNKDGRVSIKPLPENTYSFEIEAPGYAKQLLTGVVVKKSRITTLKSILLTALRAGVAAESIPQVYEVAVAVESQKKETAKATPVPETAPEAVAPAPVQEQHPVVAPEASQVEEVELNGFH